PRIDWSVVANPLRRLQKSRFSKRQIASKARMDAVPGLRRELPQLRAVGGQEKCAACRRDDCRQAPVAVLALRRQTAGDERVRHGDDRQQVSGKTRGIRELTEGVEDAYPRNGAEQQVTPYAPCAKCGAGCQRQGGDA